MDKASIFVPNKVTIRDVINNSFIFPVNEMDEFGDRQLHAKKGPAPAQMQIKIYRTKNQESNIIINGNAMFQGIAKDQKGDHQIYTCQNKYADKGNRINWVLHHVENDVYTIQNCNDGSFLFVGVKGNDQSQRKVWSGRKVKGTDRALFRISY